MKLNAECGMRNAKSRLVSSFEARVASKNFLLAPRNSQLAPSSGVTLIELLIAIAIIATLSAVFLGASRSAMESARAARTKTTISKLHTLLMEQYASYQTRRVDIRDSVLNAIDTNGSLTPQEKSQERARARLNATRELMKLEMPDRWSDVWLTTLDNPVASTSILDDRSALSKMYLRRLSKIMLATNRITGNTNTLDEVYDNQSAECLYMMVMLATGDGEARTLFSSQDIDDTDGDGAPEFIDGWKKPIRFLRWPSGFVSSLQPLDETLVPPRHNPDTDHDPFDMFKVDSVAYRYVPLIFSAGPDENPGLNFKVKTYVAINDPYFDRSGPLSDRVGAILDPALAADNIHNHVIDNR